MLTHWFQAARPKTLLAGICPIIVGTVLAVDAGVFHLLSAISALLAALFIQIGTNYANDYFDFKKGADTSERKGPTRATQAGLISPEAMKKGFIWVFAVALLCAGYIMWRGGWPIVWIGVLSIAFGILYTGGPFPLGYNGLGDLFVFIFFGPVAVGGTYFAQALTMTPEVIWLGVPSGLFSVALLVVNNLRDVNEDRKAGKRTLVVLCGTVFARLEYVLCVVVATVIPFLVLDVNKYWLFLPLVMILEVQRLLPILVTQEGAALNMLLARTARLHLSFVIVFSVLMLRF